MATILIIEDEKPIRDNLARFMRMEGHEAVLANDGEAGLAEARRCKPELVLCDVTMPRLGGFDVLAALKAEAGLADVPFYFLSASAEPERLQAGLESGASGYITKPFDLSELKALLARHFA